MRGYVCEDLFFAERTSLFSIQLLDPPLRRKVRLCPSPELEMALLAAGREEAVELFQGHMWVPKGSVPY